MSLDATRVCRDLERAEGDALEYDEIAYFRANSRAWKLLRADTSPLVLAVLGTIFIVENVRTISETDLVSRVDDALYLLNQSARVSSDDGPTVVDVHVGDDWAATYPRSAREYVDTWSSAGNGWLRKFYPDGAREAHYDATMELEKAYTFVTGLPSRSFVGTQSRLQTIVELLREIVAGADADPNAQLAELRRRRDVLDAEIARAESGELSPLDPVALRDRYQHLAATARELLSDFRAVEENFRALDRSVRADIASWDGSKGELLDQIVGDRHAISDSDQGRSFQAFHDFLLSPASRDELGDLLDRLVATEAVTADKALAHIHYDWLDAAERTQQTVRQLSEQLRRFLDDKVWLENRRVVELLRSIERSALAVRDVQTDAPGMDLAASAPSIRLPFERPLYAAATFTGVDSSIGTGDAGEADTPALEALFEQVYVDPARLTQTVRHALRGHEQVSLAEVLASNPPTQGVAELVAYLGLAEEDFEVVIDESSSVEITVDDAEGGRRAVRMPAVHIVRALSMRGTP